MIDLESHTGFMLRTGGRRAAPYCVETLQFLVRAPLRTLWCGNRLGSQTDLDPEPALQLADL